MKSFTPFEKQIKNSKNMFTTQTWASTCPPKFHYPFRSPYPNPFHTS